MGNASMFGSRQFKAIRHALVFGPMNTLARMGTAMGQMLGKIGGVSLKTVQSLGICIS